MTKLEYLALVVNHLKSGKATDACWGEVASELLKASEGGDVPILDAECGYTVPCPNCGMPIEADEACFECGIWRSDVEPQRQESSNP